MKPSPIERRALDRVGHLPEVQRLMLSQLEKGHANYGGPIDDCGYDRPRMLAETGRETADLIVYLEALTCPAEITRAAQLVASWLEVEMRRPTR